MGTSTVCRRFPRWSRVHVRPAGGTRARRCRREKRRAGRRVGGADWALPARAHAQASLMCAATCERVQGPERGDRGTDRGAASPAPERWSGRPCGRSRDGGCAQTKQRRRRHGRPRGRGSGDGTPCWTGSRHQRRVHPCSQSRRPSTSISASAQDCASHCLRCLIVPSSTC
jgi:hypothetical protein